MALSSGLYGEENTGQKCIGVEGASFGTWSGKFDVSKKKSKGGPDCGTMFQPYLSSYRESET